MRRPTLALSSSLAAIGLSATIALAQQSSQVSSSSPSPLSPVDSTDPAMVTRPTRYLLRNGMDYLAYREYARALSFFRAVEARQKELSDAEVQSLKKGIARAQQGLREAVNSPRVVVAPGKGRPTVQPGAFALASPNPATPEPVQLTSAELPSPPPAPPSVAQVATPSRSVPSLPMDSPPDALPATAAPSVTPAPLPDPSAAPAPLPDPSVTPAPLPDPSAAPAPLPDPSAAPAPLPDPSAAPAPLPDPSVTPAPLLNPSSPPVGQETPPVPEPTPAPPPATAPASPPATALAPPPATAPAPPPATAPAPIGLELPSLPPPAATVPTADPLATPAQATSPIELPPPGPAPSSSPSPSAEPAPLPAPDAFTPAPGSSSPLELPPAGPSPAPVLPEPAPVPSSEPLPVIPAPVEPPPAAALPPRVADASGVSDPGTPTSPLPSTAPEPPPVPEANPLPPLPGARTAENEPTAAVRPGLMNESLLSDRLRQEVERIAQRSLADDRQPGATPTDPNAPSAVTQGSTRLVVERAPSPTEARPLRRVPVPEEFVRLDKREWNPNRKYWAAAGSCHMILYFQDPVLERYGQGVEQALGPVGRYFSYPLDDPRQSNQRNQILQPLYSIGKFCFQVGTLPYKLIVDPPWEAEYDLGYYRPGDRIPPDTIMITPTGVGPPGRGRNY